MAYVAPRYREVSVGPFSLTSTMELAKHLALQPKEQVIRISIDGFTLVNTTGARYGGLFSNGYRNFGKAYSAEGELDPSRLSYRGGMSFQIEEVPTAFMANLSLYYFHPTACLLGGYDLTLPDLSWLKEVELTLLFRIGET